MMAPTRGFSQTEFRERTERFQRAMATEGIQVALLTTEPEVRYFSGFHTQFWMSPTRPWFLVIPARGKPIAVIPQIGLAGMETTWIDDIRSWPSPRPDDDGLTLLEQVLREALSGPSAKIGIPLGHESHLRMPAGDFLTLRDRLSAFEWCDVRGLLRAQMVIKSEAEIDKIRYICGVTSDAFEALPQYARTGMSEREICKALQLDILRRGGDATPYLIGASGPDGYDNIIMGPTDRVVGAGDVLVIDTGATFDGYFCDFDRNFAFEHASDDVLEAYRTVYAATDAGFAFARPGVTASELCAVMWAVMEAGGALGNTVGRLGHGLGMQLTEWPSNMNGDNTVLAPGMVLTLEPGMVFAPGRLMVHEENIVIRDGGAEYLSRRAPQEMTVIQS